MPLNLLLFETRWGDETELAEPLFFRAADTIRRPRGSPAAKSGGVRYFADPATRGLWLNARNAEEYFNLPQRLGASSNPSAKMVTFSEGPHRLSTAAPFLPLSRVRLAATQRRAGTEAEKDRRDAFLNDERLLSRE